MGQTLGNNLYFQTISTRCKTEISPYKLTKEKMSGTRARR